jgi:hypothetical protein
MSKPKTHAERIAENCVKNVIKTWGHGCRERLGSTIFQALVARECVSIVMMQAVYGSSTSETKASAMDYVQEVCTLAMRLADPDCA